MEKAHFLGSWSIVLNKAGKYKKWPCLKRCAYSSEVVGFLPNCNPWPLSDVMAQFVRPPLGKSNFSDFATDLLWGKRVTYFDEWPLSRYSAQRESPLPNTGQNIIHLLFWKTYQATILLTDQTKQWSGKRKQTISKSRCHAQVIAKFWKGAYSIRSNNKVLTGVHDITTVTYPNTPGSSPLFSEGLGSSPSSVRP